MLTLFPKRFIFSITAFFNLSHLIVNFLSFYVLVYKKFLLRIDLYLLGFVYSGKLSDETHYIPSNVIIVVKILSIFGVLRNYPGLLFLVTDNFDSSSFQKCKEILLIN